MSDLELIREWMRMVLDAKVKLDTLAQMDVPGNPFYMRPDLKRARNQVNGILRRLEDLQRDAVREERVEALQRDARETQ